MFGKLTEKITGALLNRAREAKQKEIQATLRGLKEEIEGLLLRQEVYGPLVSKMMEDLSQKVEAQIHQIVSDPKCLQEILLKVISTYIREETQPQWQKNIVLLGDNGCGKTTAASKLAIYLKNQGYDVEVVNLDPYRKANHIHLESNLGQHGIPVLDKRKYYNSNDTNNCESLGQIGNHRQP